MKYTIKLLDIFYFKCIVAGINMSLLARCNPEPSFKIPILHF